VLSIVGCGGSGSPGHSKRAVLAPAERTVGSVDAPHAAASGSWPVAAGTTSTTTPSGSGRASRAAFASSADAICRRFRAQARAVGGGATTLATQETELWRLVSATEHAVKKLAHLSPPANEAASFRRFATMTAGSMLAFAEAQTRTSSTSETTGAQVEARDLADSARSSSDAAAAATAARQLGLHVCGSPGSAWL
jgi:hypothetical protein